MFGLSFWEIAMVVLVALVVLGPKRLPGLARTIGSTLRSLRRASADLRHAVEEPLREVQQPLEEMRQELYETVHHFEGEVARSLRDDESEAADAANDDDADDDDLLEAGEREQLPTLTGTEPLEEVDDHARSGDDDPEAEEDAYGRVASTDPFGADPYADPPADDEEELESGEQLEAEGSEALAAGERQGDDAPAARRGAVKA